MCAYNNFVIISYKNCFVCVGIKNWSKSYCWRFFRSNNMTLISMKMVVIVEGIAVCLPNRANAKPPANPAFLDVPRRTILVTVFGLILRSRPTLSIRYPSKKIVLLISSQSP